MGLPGGAPILRLLQDGKKQLVSADQLLCAIADGNRCRVIGRRGEYYCYDGLEYFESCGFLRVHRKYAVNMDQVEAMEGRSLGFKGSKLRLPVAKRRAREVAQYLSRRL
jgi:DNA-binding LytR/AlgR family response regulator